MPLPCRNVLSVLLLLFFGSARARDDAGTKRDLPDQNIRPYLMAQTGHSNEVRSVAYSPDGKLVLTGGMDGTTRLWDAATGKASAN